MAFNLDTVYVYIYIFRMSLFFLLCLDLALAGSDIKSGHNLNLLVSNIICS